MGISLPAKIIRRPSWQTSSGSRSRRALQLVLLVMIGSVCLLLKIKPESSQVLRNFSTNIIPKQSPLTARGPRICKIEEIVNGRWVNDRPLSTLEEMRARYGLAVSRLLRPGESDHDTVRLIIIQPTIPFPDFPAPTTFFYYLRLLFHRSLTRLTNVIPPELPLSIPTEPPKPGQKKRSSIVCFK